MKSQPECLRGWYVAMAEDKQKERCFVVPRYLVSLTGIQEQMEEAVSWVVRPRQAGSR